MSLTLVQWEDSTVTPKLDAIMYDDGSYGIIKGCTITHQGTNLLKIASGFIKIAGRLIEVAEETITCEVSASGTVNGQLWIRLNLGAVTPVSFMSEAAAVLTPLTQNEDCNFENGIYELQLATYNIDESVITNLVETAPELERLRTALDNIDLSANKVTYDNTHSGMTATKVQGAIDEINDNLSGFKFYPTGTDLVALVADDSFYTDANGKYVLADSPTGQSMIDNVTYKALASTEDTRGEVGADTASPFKKKMEIVSLTGDSYYRIVNIYNTYSDTNKGIFRNDLSTLSQPIQGEFVSITNNSGTYKYWTIKALKPCHVKLMKIRDNSNVQDATVVSEANYTTNDIITSGTLLSSDDIYTLVIT